MPHRHFAALNREVDEIFVHLAIKTFALSLVGIFVPIYILQLTSLTGVLIFYAALFAAVGIFSPISAIIQSKIGSKHTVLMSMPVFVLSYMMLAAFEPLGIPLIMVGIIFGLADALYWVPFHVDIVVSTDRRHRTEQIGYMYSIPMFVAAGAPIIGGIVATLNFPILFAIASILLIASAVPLFFSPEIRRRPRLKTRLFLKEVSLRQGIAFFGNGVRHLGVIVLWPIFMFLAVESFLVFGVLGFIATFLTAIVVVVTSRVARKKGYWMFRIGSVADAITWPVRVLATTFSQLFLMSGIAGITQILQIIPFNSEMYDRSRRRPEYFVFRELWIAAGRLVLIAFVYLLAESTAAALQAGLIITALGPLAMMLF